MKSRNLGKEAAESREGPGGHSQCEADEQSESARREPTPHQNRFFNHERYTIVTIASSVQSFLQGSDLISIADLSRPNLELIIQTAQKLHREPQPDLLKGLILATCFFEPSTRTRLSFEAAMLRGGGSVIGFSDAASTSTAKGESLADTIRTVGSYADIIAIRHPQEGSARAAADATPKPVINAGDGANQHPTQTLIDLFSILACQGKIDSLHIAIAGDLKFARTVHSLCQALAHYSVRLYFVSSESLPLPEATQHELRKKGSNSPSTRRWNPCCRKSTFSI